jgi:hypothetical protein
MTADPDRARRMVEVPGHPNPFIRNDSGRLVACHVCGARRWFGLGPCRACGTESLEYEAETQRINAARAEAGLPPLDDRLE